ncbi:hypothetical protein EYF80_055366 [Liparis tanakae]|uniref:Uncharacterized protein n=1 Tax=Liparis tanakae TaxID=230148 RepID=A0A4Z2F1X3_9TELE|nr:hypothetical protein EYF80_055366 [Liparis tanakae]
MLSTNTRTTGSVLELSTAFTCRSRPWCWGRKSGVRWTPGPPPPSAPVLAPGGIPPPPPQSLKGIGGASLILGLLET